MCIRKKRTSFGFCGIFHFSIIYTCANKHLGSKQTGLARKAKCPIKDVVCSLPLDSLGVIQHKGERKVAQEHFVIPSLSLILWRLGPWPTWTVFLLIREIKVFLPFTQTSRILGGSGLLVWGPSVPSRVIPRPPSELSSSIRNECRWDCPLT